MVDERPARKRRRKRLDGEKKQFLAPMDLDVIRRLKSKAPLLDKTASELLEIAAKEWLPVEYK